MKAQLSKLILALVASLLLGAVGCGGERDAPDRAESALEMDRAVRLLEDGHLDQAYNAFGAVIQGNPRNVEAYARRGFIQLALGNVTRGIADINRALELDPDSALAHNYKGLAFAMNDIHDQAVLEFTRAVELAPGLADAYVNRGRIYLELADGESALADLDTALSLEPENAGFLVLRAQIHLILGDISNAEADLEHILSLPTEERTLAFARQLLSRIR